MQRQLSNSKPHCESQASEEFELSEVLISYRGGEDLVMHVRFHRLWIIKSVTAIVLEYTEIY